MKLKAKRLMCFALAHVALLGRFSNNITPLSDRVLVQKIKPAERTVGGIVLPESAQSKINRYVTARPVYFLNRLTLLVHAGLPWWPSATDARTWTALWCP